MFSSRHSIFTLQGQVLGKGSYSTVHLAEEKSTGKTFAMKILEKLFIQKERKEKYVMIEKEVFQKMHFSPFIVQVTLCYAQARFREECSYIFRRSCTTLFRIRSVCTSSLRTHQKGNSCTGSRSLDLSMKNAQGPALPVVPSL